MNTSPPTPPTTSGCGSSSGGSRGTAPVWYLLVLCLRIGVLIVVQFLHLFMLLCHLFSCLVAVPLLCSWTRHASQTDVLAHRQQPKTCPHPPIPVARLLLVCLCFSVFSSIWGNLEVGGGENFLGS